MSNNICKLLIMTAFTASLSSEAADAAEWGTLKGRLVYEGSYKSKPLVVNKDPEFCGKHKPMDEKIVVGPNNGLQNAFIFLVVPTGKKTAIHPDYDPKELKPAVLDNRGCRFEPHCLTVWTEQPLEIRNSDVGLGHNTNALALSANPRFNESVPNGAPIIKNFKKSELRPSQVTCSIHPWMNATVLIRDNPYMAVTGEDGSFEIKNVPAGKQEFMLFHEAKGYMRDVKLGGDKTDRKGSVEVTIPAGDTLDVGDVKVAAKVLGQ